MPVDLRDPTAIRTLDPGRCFLYVMACAHEDLLKLGFSRDPLERVQSLHRRWYEFFDVDRSLLVETDSVREARALETRLRRELSAHNAPAPLTVRREAGGHREWYRGAWQALQEFGAACAAAGHRVHGPARPWFQQALRSRTDLLYAWTEALLTPEVLEWPGASAPAQCAVRDALDAFAALEVPLEAHLPARVWSWYRACL